MADMGSSIFNKQATERLRSPDDLDKYVRVTSPSVWVTLCAILALLAGILAWGVFGTVSTSVTAMGTCVDGTPYCILTAKEVAAVKVDDFCTIDGHRTVVMSVSATPVSLAEANELLQSDYLVDVLMEEKWGYVVALAPVDDLLPGMPYSVSITTERVAPISLILG